MWAIFFKFNVKLLITHNSRELKGFNKVYMPIATRNFKNIILLIFKVKVASTSCGFSRCTKLFSHKNKVAPLPNARGFSPFFSFCGSQRAPPYRKPSKYCSSFVNKTSVSKTMGCWFVQTFFSARKQGCTFPKARGFRRFFHWIFCTTPTFDVELSTVGKLFLHAFQRYQARYLKRPWCNCPTVFLLRKSRKIAKIARFS